jgi:hypothetical protein
MEKIKHGPSLPFALETRLAFDPRAKYPYFARLLTFYDKRNNTEFVAIGQWENGLVVRVRKTANQTGHPLIAEQGIDSFFIGKTDEVLSVIIDRVKVQVAADNRILKFINPLVPDSMVMVVGNSPWGDSPWNGTACLTVKENYSVNGDSLLQVKNTAPQLVLPAFFRPIALMVLTPIWVDFTVTVSYMTDIVVNFIGFLPFGFLWAMFFYRLFRTDAFRAVTIAIFIGFSISLSIELIQVYLPYRTSQMSDVIFNTLGSATGAMLFILWKALRHRFTSDAM